MNTNDKIRRFFFHVCNLESTKVQQLQLELQESLDARQAAEMETGQKDRLSK